MCIELFFFIFFSSHENEDNQLILVESSTDFWLWNTVELSCQFSSTV